MIKKVALIAGGLILAGVVAVLAIAMTKPDEFVVVRSTSIKAPPEKIFAVVSDFHRAPEWSPWENVDPKMKRSFSGAESGKGAKYLWEGNDDIGAGYMEILEFVPPSKVAMNLHFDRPMEGDSAVEYVLEPNGDITKFTWSMRGQNNFMGKVMQVFMNCDAMVGQAFDKGLANLKALCEK